MSQLPDQTEQNRVASAKQNDEAYASLPGPWTSSYWLVVAGAVLIMSVVGCYCAIRYGHWHPLPDSHYPKV